MAVSGLPGFSNAMHDEHESVAGGPSRGIGIFLSRWLLTIVSVEAPVNTDIVTHYGGSSDLAERIRTSLVDAGMDIERLTTRDLATVDEFHIRGRRATLELAARMALTPGNRVLDIGSGPDFPDMARHQVRNLAEKRIRIVTYICRS